MYVILSIEYQLINILSGFLLLVKFGFPSLGVELGQNIPLICLIMVFRGTLTALMISTLAVISFLRYLKEFHFEHFHIWKQSTILRISLVFCILPPMITQISVFIRCKWICNMDMVDNFFSSKQISELDLCRVTPVLAFLATAFVVIALSNLAHFWNIIFTSFTIFDNNVQILPLSVFIINNQVEPHIDPQNPIPSIPPNPMQNNSMVALTFTTGFLTIIFSAFAMLATSFLTNHTVFEAVIIHVNAVILTTVLPIFWICSNNDLREFSNRKVRNIFTADVLP